MYVGVICMEFPGGPVVLTGVFSRVRREIKQMCGDGGGAFLVRIVSFGSSADGQTNVLVVHNVT